jgi:glutaredoxin
MGLSFQEKDVSKDQRAAQMMVQKTGQMGVPVIEIGSDYVVGFDKAKINRYLGRSV